MDEIDINDPDYLAESREDADFWGEWWGDGEVDGFPY